MSKLIALRFIAIPLSFFFCLSCSSLEKEETNSFFVSDKGEALASFSSNPSMGFSLALSQQRAVDRIRKLSKDKLNHEQEKSQNISFKYTLDTKSNHPKVRKWIRYYCEKDRERFQRFLNRGAKYKRMVQEVFISQGLPPDLYYLGILESGYSKKAISRVGAVGLWQFMAPTGRQYGLKINQFVDERIDPVRSTMAAARYLKELYRQKKSWHLAMASYNAGPGRVRKAIRRGDSENYWNLTRRRLLPYDTREYVPQFLAILYIGKNLKKFSFIEEKKENFLDRDLIEVPSPLKLERITKTTGVSLKEIKENNPHLLRGLTPPGSKTYPIWIKPENRQIIADHKKELSKYRIKGLKVRRFISSYRRKRRIHRVKRGQNLSVIARRYGLSVKKLKKINKLKSNRIYAGQKLKLQKTNLSRHTSLKKRRYRIRRGDNLHKISKKFGLTVKQLKKLNKLKTNKIVYGKYLFVAAKKKD